MRPRAQPWRRGGPRPDRARQNARDARGPAPLEPPSTWGTSSSSWRSSERPGERSGRELGAGGETLGDDGAVCRARRVGRRVGKWAAEARRVPRREVRHRRDAVFIHPETIREDNWSPAVRGDATVPNRGNKVGARDRCAEGFVSPRSRRDERRARSRTWSPRNTVEVMTPRSGARRELIHSRARPDLKHPHVSSSPKSKSDQWRLRRLARSHRRKRAGRVPFAQRRFSSSDGSSSAPP